MKAPLLILVLVVFFSACSPSPTPKTIYIVRHAEKMLVEDSDPNLSQAGKIRATKLSQILADKEIKHIFATDYKRARQTAQTTADLAGIQIESYDAKDQEAFAKKLEQLEGNILVVGHTDTAPRLVNILSKQEGAYPDLEDLEYENIYIVDLEKNDVGVQRKTFKDY